MQMKKWRMNRANQAGETLAKIVLLEDVKFVTHFSAKT
jgi:hypothetical protein